MNNKIKAALIIAALVIFFPIVILYGFVLMYMCMKWIFLILLVTFIIRLYFYDIWKKMTNALNDGKKWFDF